MSSYNFNDLASFRNFLENDFPIYTIVIDFLEGINLTELQPVPLIDFTDIPLDDRSAGWFTKDYVGKILVIPDVGIFKLVRVWDGSNDRYRDYYKFSVYYVKSIEEVWLVNIAVEWIDKVALNNPRDSNKILYYTPPVPLAKISWNNKLNGHHGFSRKWDVQGIFREKYNGKTWNEINRLRIDSRTNSGWREVPLPVDSWNSWEPPCKNLSSFEDVIQNQSFRYQRLITERLLTNDLFIIFNRGWRDSDIVEDIFMRVLGTTINTLNFPHGLDYSIGDSSGI